MKQFGFGSAVRRGQGDGIGSLFFAVRARELLGMGYQPARGDAEETVDGGMRETYYISNRGGNKLILRRWKQRPGSWGWPSNDDRGGCDGKRGSTPHRGTAD